MKAILPSVSINQIEAPTQYFPDTPSRNKLAKRAMAKWLLGGSSVVLLNARAQEDTNEIPQILPPHGLLPPSFWELYGVAAIIAGIIFLGLLGLVVWMRTRSQPPVEIPPETQARAALAALPITASEGERLSQVSRILRHYVQQAFELPLAELNTTEFCRVVAEHHAIGPELAGALSDFLRESDRRKFSPEPAVAAPINAVTRSLGLIEQAEARRDRLRAQTASVTAKPAA